MTNKFLLLVFLFSTTVYAGNTIRLYDKDGKYQGYIERQINETYRFYDNKGKFKMWCDKDRCRKRGGKILPLYLLTRD